MKKPVRAKRSFEAVRDASFHRARQRIPLQRRWRPKESEAPVEAEVFRRIVESANEAILVAQDFRLKFVNTKAIQIFGYDKERMLSRPFAEFIHPEDRGMVLERHERRMAGDDLLHTYPCRIIDREGRVRWFEINAVKFEWEEKPATLICIPEITKQKEAEEELRTSTYSNRSIQPRRPERGAASAYPRFTGS